MLASTCLSTIARKHIEWFMVNGAFFIPTIILLFTVLKGYNYSIGHGAPV